MSGAQPAGNLGGAFVGKGLLCTPTAWGVNTPGHVQIRTAVVPLPADPRQAVVATDLWMPPAWLGSGDLRIHPLPLCVLAHTMFGSMDAFIERGRQDEHRVMVNGVNPVAIAAWVAPCSLPDLRARYDTWRTAYVITEVPVSLSDIVRQAGVEVLLRVRAVEELLVSHIGITQPSTDATSPEMEEMQMILRAMRHMTAVAERYHIPSADPLTMLQALTQGQAALLLQPLLADAQYTPYLDWQFVLDRRRLGEDVGVSLYGQGMLVGDEPKTHLLARILYGGWQAMRRAVGTARILSGACDAAEGTWRIATAVLTSVGGKDQIPVAEEMREQIERLVLTERDRSRLLKMFELAESVRLERRHVMPGVEVQQAVMAVLPGPRYTGTGSRVAFYHWRTRLPDAAQAIFAELFFIATKRRVDQHK